MISIPCEEHTLENGLRIVLSPEPSVPIVAVNLWYEVGSRNEGPGQTGLAHLFEHMMFQGSRHVAGKQHFELLKRVGGWTNATTWFDRTNYFETLPSHHLELALWLEADRMGWMLPALTAEKLENERDVVKNERRQRLDNQPYGDSEERLLAMIYPPGHPYRHSVIGSMEDIDGFTLADLESFYRAYYAPDNAVLTLCGGFDSARALDWIERYFGGIPPGTGSREIPGDADAERENPTSPHQTVEADVPLARVYVAMRLPTFDDPAFSAADVACRILGRGRASRLHRSLTLDRGIAKHVGAYVDPLMTGASMMVVAATGNMGVEGRELEAAIAEEIDGLRAIAEKEVARAVAMAETAILRQLEVVARRADRLSMFATHFRDPTRLSGEIDRLRAVTPEAVEALVDARLGPENRAVLTYVPRASA